MQGQQGWDELLSQVFTICTLEASRYQDLKKHGLPPNPLFNCPGFSVDRVVIGVLRCLDLGVTQYVLWQCHVEGTGMAARGSRLRSARCATMWIRLQQHCKEQHTPSQIQPLPLTVIKAEWEITQVQGRIASKASTLFLFVCVALAIELHAVYGSPHTRQVLAVVTDFC